MYELELNVRQVYSQMARCFPLDREDVLSKIQSQRHKWEPPFGGSSQRDLGQGRQKEEREQKPSEPQQQPTELPANAGRAPSGLPEGH